MVLKRAKVDKVKYKYNIKVKRHTGPQDFLEVNQYAKVWYVRTDYRVQTLEKLFEIWKPVIFDVWKSFLVHQKKENLTTNGDDLSLWTSFSAGNDSLILPLVFPTIQVQPSKTRFCSVFTISSTFYWSFPWTSTQNRSIIYEGQCVW